MQTKVGLAQMVKNFEFSINRKTAIPIQFDPLEFILTAKGGIWLDVRKVA